MHDSSGRLLFYMTEQISTTLHSKLLQTSYHFYGHYCSTIKRNIFTSAIISFYLLLIVKFGMNECEKQVQTITEANVGLIDWLIDCLIDWIVYYAVSTIYIWTDGSGCCLYCNHWYSCLPGPLEGVLCIIWCLGCLIAKFGLLFYSWTFMQRP